MRKKAFPVIHGIILISYIIFFCGCNKNCCNNGMCSINGENLTESQVRENASVFAYKKLLERQENPRIAICNTENEPYPVEQIDPASWDVVQTKTGWKLKRYFAKYFWHVVECNFDGLKAIHYYDVSPEIEL